MNHDVTLEDSLLDVLPVGVWVLDSDLRVLAVNSKIEELFGKPCKQFVGRNKRELVANHIQEIFENGDEFYKRISATYENNTYTENFTCHVLEAPDRKERWLEHFSHPIVQDGVIIGRAEVYFDITDRMKHEEEILWISNQFLQSQEREKAHISNYLHSGVSQSIVALHLSVEQLKAALAEKGVTAQQPLIDDISKQIQMIGHDIGKLSSELLPPTLSALGLEETLHWTASTYESLYGLRLKIDVLGFSGKRFSDEIETAVFRIIQEALNNVTQHGNTESVACKLIYCYPELVVRITDEGTGFDTNQPFEGVGLRIMRRRVAELGGELTIRSQPGVGTEIRAVIPVRTERENGTVTGVPMEAP